MAEEDWFLVPNMKDIKKILIIRLGAIGDAVFTTIIPYAIKLKYPDCEVHYVLQKEVVGLMGNNPYIDKIFTWDRQAGKKFGYIYKMSKIFAEEKYDVIFNLNNTLKTFLLSFLSFPRKIVPKKQYGKSWVEDFFITAKTVFSDIEIPDRLYLGINPDSENKINGILDGYKRPFFVFTPGGATSRNRAGRMWSLDFWNNLSDMVLKNFGGTIFVCGSSSEKEIHTTLKKDGVVVLSGDLSLEESGAILSKADLVVSGDTGPLHIASAYNVKTLALLGSTSPDKIKPYGKNGYWISSDFECKYCWKKKCKYMGEKGGITPCMSELKPMQVFEKIENILK
ncbi:glycosyltransferase family 9 protein [bacterium]|nr:glycosyltransferase family 9 protein [bacterium]